MKLTKLLEDIYQQVTGKVDDHESEMAITDLKSLAQRASQLADYLEKNNVQELEGWVQAKITKSADYIGSVYDNYMYSPHKQDDGDCGCGGGCEDCQDESHVATLSYLPSMKEEKKKATCCYRCGRVHVKGTTCKRPYLTGKESCKNKK